MQAELRGQFAHRRERSRAADGERGRRIVEEIFELGERIGGVERQQRRARLQAGEQQHDGVGRFVDLRGDTVARLDAEIDQRARRLSGAGEELAVGQRQPARRVERQLLAARRAVEKQIEEIVGHDGNTKRFGVDESGAAAPHARVCG